MKFGLDSQTIATIKQALTEYKDTTGATHTVPSPVFEGKEDISPFHIHDIVYALADKVAKLEDAVKNTDKALVEMEEELEGTLARMEKIISGG